ncbi:TonB family protein [Ferrimonas sp. YFM]|uniref:TonB family protein n=1 Tax=Ferrimonas sp. YFM TaxID=3028878 RepID=UPI002572AE88|nr:TonB family protein [Ferrimonas sp. YFM]BDY04632.1 cell envelope biogenesis protein TonB [Ferrimonas sp. YFM]
MKNLVLAASLALALVGCASTPVLNGSPIEVTQGDTKNYWVLKQSQFTTSTPHKRIPSQGAVVEVRYLIDSNGQTHEAEVIKAEPIKGWNRSALNAVKKMEYVAVPGNPDKTPVYTVTEFTFKVEDSAQSKPKPPVEWPQNYL